MPLRYAIPMQFIRSAKKRVVAGKTWLQRNQRILAPAILLGGFFIDTLTLNRIDQTLDNLILAVHTIIVGACILLLQARYTKVFKKLNWELWSIRLRLVMLFSFGGLFSGFFIFYIRSAAIGQSWPFIILLLLLMLATEWKKDQFNKITLQLYAYFVAVFSFAIFLLPVLVKKMGPWIFVISGLLALGFIAGIIYGFRQINPARYSLDKRRLLFGIGSIFIAFHLLYFTNIIPPIPLSLKFRAPYYSVQRVSPGSYEGVYQSTGFFNLRKRGRTLYLAVGEPAYVFGSVFAPNNFDVTIYHRWEHKRDGEWIQTDRIPVSLAGGRGEGFRAFTKKQNLTPGTWRVSFVTERDQSLGSLKFKIKSEVPPRDKETEDL